MTAASRLAEVAVARLDRQAEQKALEESRQAQRVRVGPQSISDGDVHTYPAFTPDGETQFWHHSLFAE